MSQKFRRSYNNDVYEENRHRRFPQGNRYGQHSGIVKYKRGRLNDRYKFSDNAMSRIREGKYHGGQDFEVLPEKDPMRWYKVSVIFGAQVPKDWIVNKLREVSSEDLKLVNYQTEGKNVVSYVRTKDSVIRYIRRQAYDFVDPSGKRMILNATGVVEPSVTKLTESMEQDIKICLNNRYSFETKLLDLTAFNKDSHLQSVDLYLPLSRQIVVQYVSQILLESLEELNGLILSSNQLESLLHFKPFADRFPDMKTVDISYNRLKQDGALDVFRGCKQIESLDITGNPFFRSHNFDTYFNVMRRRFPNLQKLNGKKLPPRIKFGVDETEKKPLPTPLLGYFPSEEMKLGIINFLKMYYDKYDSGKRDSLLDIYAENAVLTWCVAPVAHEVHQKCARYSEAYYNSSRNLLRVKEDDKRKKRVCHGKLQVVSALDRLPKTEHFLDSFRVDVIYHNNTTILMNVTGVYREMEEHGNVIRVFTRVIQIEAPQLVKIDNLLISHPSTELDKKYRNASKVVPEAEPVASPSQPAIASPPSYSAVTSPPSHSVPSEENMVLKMMKATGMNRAFSKQCLSDFQFDYECAMKAFLALRNANQIPPHAFV